MTYEENLLKASKIMAPILYKNKIVLPKWNELTEKEKEWWYYKAEEFAIEAIKLQEEAFKLGFNDVYDFTNDVEFGPDIVKGLVKNGLVPEVK